MRKRGNRSRGGGSFPILALALIAAGVLYSPHADAYLDAGTGSLILQVVAGLFLGIFLTIKLWWYRLVGVIRKLSGARNLDAE